MTKPDHCHRVIKCWIPPFTVKRAEIPIPPPIGTVVFSDPGYILFTVPDGARSVEYFIIGGGGSNGSSWQTSNGGGRGLFLSGTFPLNMWNLIAINVGFGGSGGSGEYDNGNTGGTSSIIYGMQNIIVTGGNPGMRGSILIAAFSSIGGDGGNDSGGGRGGGITSTNIPKFGGTGGNSGQGLSGQNGQSSIYISGYSGGTGGTSRNGENGITFSSSLDPIFSIIPGLGGIGGQGLKILVG